GGAPQVVVLALPQRLGRRFGAVVMPGCDERHLPASPDPSGAWSAEQRAALGLPDRAALRASAESAWGSLFDGTPLDLLWRHQDQGEPLLPSPWIDALGAAPAAAQLLPRS